MKRLKSEALPDNPLGLSLSTVLCWLTSGYWAASPSSWGPQAGCGGLPHAAVPGHDCLPLFPTSVDIANKWCYVSKM